MMGSFKGNVGTLMQHWTLCELLSVASKHVAGLNYIDTYAMAPWATQRTDHSREFDRVRNRLPGQESVYERAWHRIVNLHQTEGYPSSAAFVHELWNGPYSLLLCENDCLTADKVDRWLAPIRISPECEDATLFRGDWRDRFAHPLPNPRDVDLAEHFLTFVSFDPDKYDRGPDGQNPRDLHPRDLERALQALENLDGGVLLQVSTYSRGRRNENPQGAVISSVNAILTSHRFALAALVWTHGNMMSLVYARYVEWANMLARLPEQFDEWRRPRNRP